MTRVYTNGIPFPVSSQSSTSAFDLEIAGVNAPSTPLVQVCEATLQRNLDRLQQYAARQGLNLRPHAKTHKSLDIGRRQLERGAVGLTVAKPSEAEVLAEACHDLLIAYSIVDERKARQVARLALTADVKAAVDSALAVEALSAAAASMGSTIGILIDLDVGLHRTGVQDAVAATELAIAVDNSPGLQLRGLFCYPGHIVEAPKRQHSALRAVAERLEETLDAWHRRGLDAEIVSGGSTPTAYQSHLAPQVTEIRPGTYVFNDMNTVHGGFAGIDDCAARIVASVVSTAVPDQVVIDAGSKTLAADRCLWALDSGYGHVVEHPHARITKLSEEHGQIDVSQCAIRPRLGERLSIIPNHICPCINLQDHIWLQTTEGRLEALSVHARGKLT